MDSISCSVTQKRWVNSGYFRELPLCPLYGIGGLVLFFSMKYMLGYPPIIVVLTSTLVINLVEYVGGVWCVLVLKERLWDYSRRKWHLHGHIDLVHAFCWLALVTCVYMFLFPTFISFDTYVQNIWIVPLILDRTTVAVFLLGSLYLTITRRTHRLRHMKKGKKKHYSR